MTDKLIKILLIEDNPGDVRLIREMLSEVHSLRIDLAQADRLDTGLELIGEYNLDAILLDLNLPDSKGLDTLDKISSKASGLPVIVLTGVADESVGIAAVKAGAQDYLIKGQVDSAVLLRSIRYAIERKQAEDALRASEGTYRTLLENLPQKVFFKGRNSVYVSCNRHYAMDLKIDPSGIRGKTDYDFYPEELAEKYRRDDKRIMESGDPEDIEERYMQNGQERWVHTVKTPVRDEGGTIIGILGIFWDITERKRAEEALRQVIRALKTLSECNEVVVRASEEAELLQQICSVLVETGGYHMAWVGFADADNDRTIRVVARAGSDEAHGAPGDMVWVDATRNPVGVVIRTGKPYICQNTQADPNYARRRAEALKLGYLSLISLPLIASGLTFGALNIHADEPDAFDLEETKLLTELADDLAYGIMALRMRVEHKRGEARLQQSFTQLRKTLEDTVNSLASAVGQRDPYTAGHQQRVTKLALAIGVEMALPQEQVDGIRIAGLLHDIGKIGVPAEILSKPTKLTDAEFLIVKGHTTVGYDILKGIDFPWPIARIVGQHHERLNGSGYPYGLKGPDILLEAKILAVADVVEAMSSHRPYRPARGIEAALDEINKNRGLLYDAAVVEACLRLFTEKAFKFESPA